MMLTGSQLAFLVLAGITIASAALVVLLPNLVRSALFLVIAFLGVGGVYILLHSPFLFATQVMIYVGAIMVLMLFAILLTNRLAGATVFQTSQWVIPGGIVAALVFAFIGKAVVLPFNGYLPFVSAEPSIAGSGGKDAVFEIARLLLQLYALPFELASVVLLAALIAAVVIGKEDKADDPA
jgi:NADH-quinone oxidoreductase subunit J